MGRGLASRFQTAARASLTWACAAVLLLFLFLFLQVEPARSCTLIGASTESLMLLGKNRDRTEDFVQVVDRVETSGKRTYLGLRSIHRPNVVAGMNDAGLAMVNATVHTDKNKGARGHEIALMTAGSVDEVVEMTRRGEIPGPVIALFADGRRLIALEYYDRDHFAVEDAPKGTALARTNHFLTPELKPHDQKPDARSSNTRLARARDLIAQLGPIDSGDVAAILADEVHGQSTMSIARTRTKPGQAFTLAQTLFELPTDKGKAAPAMIVTFGHPGCNAPVRLTMDSALPAGMRDGSRDKAEKAIRDACLEGRIGREEARERSRALHAGM